MIIPFMIAMELIYKEPVGFDGKFVITDDILSYFQGLTSQLFLHDHSFSIFCLLEQ